MKTKLVYQNNRIGVVCKYLPDYRYAVFNRLSSIKELYYDIIGDTEGREGIKTIPKDILSRPVAKGGINFSYSKSYYYTKSLLLWETNVLKKIFSNQYKLFVFDGAISHISSWIFALICRVTNKKVIFWSHGFKGTDKGIKKIVRTIFFKYLPHGLILYGNFSKDIMVAEGFKKSKIFAIGNSLNYHEQKQMRDNWLKKNDVLQNFKKEIFNNNYPTLIFIGRLVSNKKVNEVLNAMAEIAEKGTILNCIIIGDGTERSRLVKQVETLKLEGRVHFSGALYEENDIAKHFLISDLMVSPGNVGLNCIHSLSFGVPVLTHDNFGSQNPEVEAISNGENGLFYAYNDFNDMTLKINKWFSEPRENVFQKCVEPIERHYNPETHCMNIHNAIVSILENRG